MQQNNSTSNNTLDMFNIMLQMLGGSDNAESNEQAVKMQQAMHMMQMFQTFNSLNQSSDANEDTTPAENTTIPPNTTEDTLPNFRTNTDFYDTQILTPELITIKAALPHIELKYQKPLGMLVKLIELQRLMKHYESGGNVQVQSNCSNSGTSAAHTRNMLAAIHSNTTDETSRTKIDALMKALDISELLQKIPAKYT